MAHNHKDHPVSDAAAAAAAAAAAPAAAELIIAVHVT